MMEKNKTEVIEYLKKLGDRISKIRKEKKITQTELGYRIDVERGNMRRIEAGRTNPTILTLRKIAVALEIDLTDLLKDIK